MTNYYPLLMKLDYKKVVIVGGGHVAAQKVASLRDTKALITVVSPKLHDKLIPLAEEGIFTWCKKSFEPKDLDDAILIIAATNDKSVNEAVQEASQHWQLVNRTDEQHSSDFITPAVLRRGQLVFTVSTSGASPSLARQLKDDLAQQFDEIYADYVDFLEQARLMISAKYDKGAKRSALLKALLAPEILEWIRNGDVESREAFLQNLLTGDAS